MRARSGREELAASGRAGGPPGRAPRRLRERAWGGDLAARLPALRDRLTTIRGERLERLPRIERWTLGEFRRYLLQRWEREWPLAVAQRDERILVALELWPSGLDYRVETLRVVVEETNAAYLEDRDTIAVLQSGSVSDRTLIHELTHALQQQRWGPLRTPQTFAEEYVQSAWLEREALLVEERLPRPLLSATPALDPPRADPRAHRWLNLEPARGGPSAGLSAGESRGAPRGWRGLPGGRPQGPDSRGWGSLQPGDQSLGRRGVAHWAEQIGLGLLSGFGYEGQARWYLDDRVRLEPERLVWRIRCDQRASQVVSRLSVVRPELEVQRAGGLVVIRIPLRD